MTYDPYAFRAACMIEHEGPLTGTDLPSWMYADPDLARNLDARYGVTLEAGEFALLRAPVKLLVANLPAPNAAFFARVRAEGPEVYRAMERDWRTAWSPKLSAISRNIDPFALDEEYPDGERRARLVQTYRDTARAGGLLPPLVVDLHYMTDTCFCGVDLLDGYHRLAGAVLADAPTIGLYELMNR